ncbi:NAD-dependent epimerase/dehydratase family protein [Tichowtungia aerotolerans]|uniref:NAD-dependent epimerase/dehydratase family protein n=1 Tax=Tichowtungia aerotolerans TaxID=2697043 RepID=A0A6P1MH81_9BACT|nr:NAD-dependent epimerase/dehydratase family protein [Tichowtungia aerotolerans]
MENSRVLVTGGAGFIGSNLIDALMEQNNEVVCLDNFSNGKRENIVHHEGSERFHFIEGDIRSLDTCHKACDGIDYVLHQAALGSVPRSIKNPILSTEVNIMGFLNMLVAARDAKVKRFVYAASSSTYGDSKTLPKVENVIGKPLSPYAITKYVNELYADNFSELYGLETVGLRYFNVFGRRQDPFGAYAAVIPKFVMALMKYESPVINGDGSFSRDFTYVDNVVQANQLAALVATPEAVNTVYNVACGERTDLNELVVVLRKNLAKFDPRVADVQATHGSSRAGDIPHSLADIGKAKCLLGYDPQFGFTAGIQAAAEWYFKNLDAVPSDE